VSFVTYGSTISISHVTNVFQVTKQHSCNHVIKGQRTVVCFTSELMWQSNMRYILCEVWIKATNQDSLSPNGHVQWLFVLLYLDWMLFSQRHAPNVVQLMASATPSWWRRSACYNSPQMQTIIRLINDNVTFFFCQCAPTNRTTYIWRVFNYF